DREPAQPCEHGCSAIRQRLSRAPRWDAIWPDPEEPRYETIVVAAEQQGMQAIGLNAAHHGERERGHDDRLGIPDAINRVSPATVGLEVERTVAAGAAVLVHRAQPPGELVAEEQQALRVLEQQTRDLLCRRIIGHESAVLRSSRGCRVLWL